MIDDGKKEFVAVGQGFAIGYIEKNWKGGGVVCAGREKASRNV
jgi:hypothetical protein